MNKRYSLYKIESEVLSSFDESAYSRFKFGDTFYAKEFGEKLFEGFIQEFSDLILQQEEVILFPSPYYSIPTASNFLCRFFKDKLNYFLFMNAKNACIEGKIHRQQTYVEDYGNMSYEQRINLIANDTYYLDKHFVEGKFCIFLDDIKITGSHENTINRILKQYDIKGEFIFVYFAELINKNINPKIENHFNYYSIKTIDDIIEIINSKYFQFNTRITKYLLLLETNNFDFLCKNINRKKKQEILNLAISNNYHKIKEYINNIKKLKNEILWQSTYKKGKDRILMHQNLPLD